MLLSNIVNMFAEISNHSQDEFYQKINMNVKFQNSIEIEENVMQLLFNNKKIATLNTCKYIIYH